MNLCERTDLQKDSRIPGSVKCPQEYSKAEVRGCLSVGEWASKCSRAVCVSVCV